MRLDVDALFASVSGRPEARVVLRALPRRPRDARRCCSTARVLPLREDRMALAFFTATQLPLVVAITTVAVDGGHMRSSTAAALVGAGALSTLAGPLHGLRMRRIAAPSASRRRAPRTRQWMRRSRDEPRRQRSRASSRRRDEPAVPVAHLAQLGDVASGARAPTSSPSRWRSGCRCSTSTSGIRARCRSRRSAAQGIFEALAAGMITFTGIVFSAVFVAAQIQTSSYSPRLAARLRRDPVVIAGLALPTATASYALFALAAIGRQTPPVRRLRPRHHGARRTRAGGRHARGLRGARPAGVREHADRRHPALAHAARRMR